MSKGGPARPLQLVVDFERQDTDGLAELISRRFAPVRIEPARPGELVGVAGTFGAVGGLDFSRARFTGDFTIFPQRHYDGVFFFFPIHGTIVFRQAHDVFLGTPTTALAAEGSSCRSMEVSSDHRQVGVVIARTLLAERLSVLLGRPIVEKPVFQPVVDLDLGALNGLKALIECATGPELGFALSRAALTIQRLQEMLVDMVLEVWPHTYSEILRRPPPMIAPRHVKLAVDFINDHPEAGATGTELATLAGVSLRSLQAGFRRFAGLSIAAYQRQVRLEKAREDLTRGPPVSVEEVALRWGFTNAGRFSRYFRQAYGINPTALVRDRRDVYPPNPRKECL